MSKNDPSLADLRPCGYVLASSEYKNFAIKCLFCYKKYAHWATFLTHLRRRHDSVHDEEVPWFRECTEDTTTIATESSKVTVTDQRKEDYLDSVNEMVCCMRSSDDTHTYVDITLHNLNGSTDSKDCDAAGIENPNEELLYKSQEEEIDLIENEQSDLGSSRYIEFEKVDIIEESYDDSSYTDLNTTSEIHIDLSKIDMATDRFIEVLKNFPLLWSNENMSTDDNNKKCVAKLEMLRSLTEQNILISLKMLEDAILQLQQQYFDIIRRLEEDIVITSIEEKYFVSCMFLKPYNNTKEMQEEESEMEPDGTKSEASLNDLDFVDKGSQSGCDLSDDEIDALQNNWQSHQTILKFSTRNKVTADFIKYLGKHPCLWDPKHTAYKNSKEREKALDQIKEFFKDNYSVPLTERKINCDIKRVFSFYNRCTTSHRKLNTTRKYYYELCDYLSNVELHGICTQRGDIQQKLKFSKIDETTLGFIDFCAMHPVLWDKSHPNYSNFTRRKEAYDEIAQNLQQLYNKEFSHEDIYYAISRLKHHYYSLQRKRDQLDMLLKNEELELLDRCSFLPKSKTYIKCHICQRFLRSNCTLQIHLLKVHNIGELPHKCDYCEQRFAQGNAKRKHEVRNHTKQYEWICPYCSKGFWGQREMENHQMVHTGERKIVCDICGKGFRLKSQMTEHVKITHERLRRFKCSLCPKDFLRKRQLDDHVRVHLNICDRICNVCGKAFTTVHALFRHKQQHRGKQFVCDECGRCFSHMSELNQHKQIKHTNNAGIHNADTPVKVLKTVNEDKEEGEVSPAYTTVETTTTNTTVNAEHDSFITCV